MKTLTIGNAMKSLILLAAGVALGAFLLGPINVGAQEDDDDDSSIIVVEPTPAMFTLTDSEDNPFQFTLVDNGVWQVLTLYEEQESAPIFNDDDD